MSLQSGARVIPVTILLAMVVFALPVGASAQDAGARQPEATVFAPGTAISTGPGAAALASRFDVRAETDRYIASVPAAARARSDAYFEGGYWILLWDFLLALAVNAALLRTRVSARMRSLAERCTRFRPIHVAVYWLQYLAITSVLLFPMTVYRDFAREHRYGLSTQTFGAWLGDQSKGLLVGAIIGAIFVPVLYSVVRRATRTWWLWGAGVSTAFIVIGIVIAPVFIAPLFNRYQPLRDAAVREPILRMARSNGVGVTDVLQFDASRQSNRISANVSGLFGTERISLNDNLLRRCDLPEIEHVMGHEIGHYVLNHVFNLVFFLAAVVLVGFALMRRGFEALRERAALRWDVRGIDDPAGLPLLSILFSVYLFLLTPVLNTAIRVQEYEADVFGLNLARQPDGMARVTLKLGEYRKLDPGPVEEWLFFDHPSGRTRITTAMRWKAEHIGEPGAP